MFTDFNATDNIAIRGDEEAYTNNKIKNGGEGKMEERIEYTTDWVRRLAEIGERANESLKEEKFKLWKCITGDKAGKYTVYFQDEDGRRIFDLRRVPIDTLLVDDSLKDELRKLLQEKKEMHKMKLKETFGIDFIF